MTGLHHYNASLVCILKIWHFRKISNTLKIVVPETQACTVLPVQIKLVMLTIDSKFTTPDFSYVHLLDIVCQTFLKFLTVNNLDGNGFAVEFRMCFFNNILWRWTYSFSFLGKLSGLIFFAVTELVSLQSECEACSIVITSSVLYKLLFLTNK